MLKWRVQSPCVLRRSDNDLSSFNSDHKSVFYCDSPVTGKPKLHIEEVPNDKNSCTTLFQISQSNSENGFENYKHKYKKEFQGLVKVLRKETQTPNGSSRKESDISDSGYSRSSETSYDSSQNEFDSPDIKLPIDTKEKTNCSIRLEVKADQKEETSLSNKYGYLLKNNGINDEYIKDTLTFTGAINLIHSLDRQHRNSRRKVSSQPANANKECRAWSAGNFSYAIRDSSKKDEIDIEDGNKKCKKKEKVKTVKKRIKSAKERFFANSVIEKIKFCKPINNSVTSPSPTFISHCKSETKSQLFTVPGSRSFRSRTKVKDIGLPTSITTSTIQSLTSIPVSPLAKQNDDNVYEDICDNHSYDHISFSGSMMLEDEGGDDEDSEKAFSSSMKIPRLKVKDFQNTISKSVIKITSKEIKNKKFHTVNFPLVDINKLEPICLPRPRKQRPELGKTPNSIYEPIESEPNGLSPVICHKNITINDKYCHDFNNSKIKFRRRQSFSHSPNRQSSSIEDASMNYKQEINFNLISVTPDVSDGIYADLYPVAVSDY